MTEIHTAEQLSRILSDARVSQLKNEVLLMPEVDAALTEKVQSPDAPQLGKMLHSIGGTKALMQCLNYWEIRDQVHDHQQRYQVSGIVERVRVIRGKEFRYLDWDDQLLLLDSDLPILKVEASKVVEFFLSITRDYDLFLDVSNNEFNDSIPTDESAIRRHAVNATYCWIFSSSTAWEEVKPGLWQSCRQEVKPIDDDEIGIYLHLGRPDDDDDECLRFVAMHRDKSRFPWM